MWHVVKWENEQWNQNKRRSKHWIYHTGNLQGKKKVYDKYAKGSMCEKKRDFIRELEITKENKMEML